jgi:transcriptional regulator
MGVKGYMSDSQTIGQSDINIISKRKLKAPKGIDHTKTIELHKKGLSQRDIAKYQDCNVANINRVLQRYGLEQRTIKDYESNQTEIFLGLQEKIIKTINDKEIEKAPLQVKMLGLGLIFDKTRLLQDRSTSNTSLIERKFTEIQSLSQSE